MDSDDDCCVGCCTFVCQTLCSCWCFIILLLLIGVLVPAFGVVYPARATVKAASLSRFTLAGANGTTLAYDLGLSVAIRNRCWAMHAQHSAPLDAELRFAGRRIDGARLADKGRRMDPRSTEEFPVIAVSHGVELEGDAAAEFARQSVLGVFDLELRLTGAFRYGPVHVGGSKRLDVTCPLKLQVAHAPVLNIVVTCY